MAIGKNAVIRFADEKPKPKTPAPKPGRLKVSDGAKALAAFNRTAAKKKQARAAACKPSGRHDRAERTLAEQPPGAVDESC